MKNLCNAAEPLSARQFAECLLAALAVGTQKRLPAGQIHRAFRQLLTEVQESSDMKVDFSDVDYDPLYGQSAWLDQFLARAQRDLMISYPNPSYERIEIKVTSVEGREILDLFSKEDSEKFIDLSQRLIAKLSV